MSDAGFDLEMLDPRLSEADADRLIAVDQGRALRHPFTADMLRERVRSELALATGWRPDVIVIASTMSLFVSARAAGVPLVYVGWGHRPAGPLSDRCSARWRVSMWR